MLQYDMVTSPITTPHFHSRVLALLSSALSHLQSVSHESNGTLSAVGKTPPVVVSPLSPLDTPLSPDESMSHIIALTSSWIDLCSPDPLIAEISQQVLKLELAYAAFCGISYVIIPGPRLRADASHMCSVTQFSRAVLEALSQGPYIQIQIWLPMIDHPNDEAEEMGALAPFARQLYFGDEIDDGARKLDLFGTWEAWNIIRLICNYHTRLCVGKNDIANTWPRHLPSFAQVPSAGYFFHYRRLNMIFTDSSFTQHFRYPSSYPLYQFSRDGTRSQ